jgi:predicted RNA binding protein YcfA (HicA-like mRNA interferase family)
MQMPRNIKGKELAKALGRFGYVITRQSGSHIRMCSKIKGHPHQITIPDSNPLRIGTLNNILNEVSAYVDIDKKELIRNLFE